MKELIRREESNANVEEGVSKTDPEEEIPSIQRSDAENTIVVTIDETAKPKYPEKQRTSLEKLEYAKVLQETQAKVTSQNDEGSKGIGFLPKNYKTLF